jgi:hypothetical protein
MPMARCAILVVGAVVAAAAAARASSSAPPLPFWTAPVPSPSLGPWGGASAVPNTTMTRLYYAVPSVGTYSHAAMIDFHYGQFLVTFKNSPRDEDQDGQRVLYTQGALNATTNAVEWTGVGEIFPNVSTASNPARLFAGPPIHINGRLYAAASPIQYCLYPAPFPAVLLLRRVDVPGFGTLGPVFWASPAGVPAGYEEATALRGILTLNETDADTQADIAALANTLVVPCGPDCADGETKCEGVINGTQEWDVALEVPGIQNERTHFSVPGTEVNPVDILLYRNTKGALYASRRDGLDGDWVGPFPTNISDAVSNINSGVLPDGRIYLVSNAMRDSPNGRDPLFLTTSTDGFAFDATLVVGACNQTGAFGSPEPCKMRYPGASKSPGLEYPQAVAVTEVGSEGLWVVFSLNKEDIWVARVPFAF